MDRRRTLDSCPPLKHRVQRFRGRVRKMKVMAKMGNKKQSLEIMKGETFDPVTVEATFF